MCRGRCWCSWIRLHVLASPRCTDGKCLATAREEPCSRNRSNNSESDDAWKQHRAPGHFTGVEFDECESDCAMVQYAAIDEAWTGCAPPTRYAPLHSEPFDVARYDGGGAGSGHGGVTTADNLTSGDTGLATESAYPAYERMHGSRSTDALAEHGERSTDRLESGGPYPQSMYDASPTSATPLSLGTLTSRTSGASLTQRQCMYDLLVFFLFGLLAVLMLHEVAVLGESIGAERVAALASEISRTY